MELLRNSKPEGGAYGRARAQSNALLTEVGPGTPCGEYMRRFWQPVLASERFTSRPREVRILGEDLIAFRDGSGRPGLLYPRCMHRGTSLIYGHVEPDGIRCCYHGWKFAVDGTCIDQPCEPGGGLNRAAARQPWYAVEERYGLVWAYMGPPGKIPALPRWDVLVNNAGVALFGDKPRQASRDGLELHFQVNYLAPFLLTHLLLPAIRAAAPARVVNVASIGQAPIDFADVQLERSYSGLQAYRQSKLAQIMFTIDLAERLRGTGVTVTALHPGTLMNTKMVLGQGMTPQTPVEEGIAATVRLAVSADVEGETGVYFNQQTPQRANEQAYDAAARRRLWELSVKLAGLPVD